MKISLSNRELEKIVTEAIETKFNVKVTAISLYEDSGPYSEVIGEVELSEEPIKPVYTIRHEGLSSPYDKETTR